MFKTNKPDAEQLRRQHGKIVAPPNSMLKLDVQDEPVSYFCEYR